MPYSPHSDVMAHFLGVKWSLYASLQAGHGIPTWRSDQFSGTPFLTNPQALVFYPLDFLFYLVSPTQAVGPTMFLHFIVAGAAGYQLGRALGLGTMARTFVATASLLNFKLILAGYMGWMPVLPVLALLPAVLGYALALLDAPSARAVAMLAGVLALSLHGGSPQELYYLGLVLAPYALLQMWRERSKHGPGPRKALSMLAGSGAAAALALALTAHLLVPLLSELPLMSRGSQPVEAQVSRLSPSDALTFLTPEAAGTPLDGSRDEVEVAYFGVVPLFLALAAALRARRRAHVPFMMAAFVAAVSIAFSVSLQTALYKGVPGFGLFRFPSRMLFVSNLMGIGLAGVGVDELMVWLGSKQSTAFASRCALLLLGFVALEGSFFGRSYLWTKSTAEVVPSPAFLQVLSRDPAPFRVAPVARALNYGWAAPFGLELVTGYDPLYLTHYREYFELLGHGKLETKHSTNWVDLLGVSRPDLLDALNVKYVLSAEPIAADGLELVKGFHHEPSFDFYHGLLERDLYLYRNLGVLPRVSIPDRTVVVATRTELLQRVQQQGLREGMVVLAPGQNEGGTHATGVDSVSLSERWPGHLVIDTNLSEARWLRISEVWHPGWQALLDGQPSPLFQADLALMGAQLPKGQHRLVLSFAPLNQHVGWAVSLVGALLWLGLIAAAQKRHPQTT